MTRTRLATRNRRRSSWTNSAGDPPSSHRGRMSTSTAPAASASTASSPLADPAAVVCNTRRLASHNFLDRAQRGAPGQVQVHEHDCRPQPPYQVDGTGSARRVGDDDEPGRRLHHRAQPPPRFLDFVDDQDPDRLGGRLAGAGRPSALELRPGTDTDASHRTAAQSHFRYRRPQRWLEPPTSGEAQARRLPRGAYDAADAREHNERG